MLLLLILTLPVLGSVSADIIGESILITFLGGLPLLAYRREPVVQERFDCVKREREQETSLASLQRRVREQDQKVSQFRGEEKKAKTALEHERDVTRQNEQKAHQRASAELKSKMDALTARQQQITRSLQKLQADYQAGLARSNQQLAACNQQQVQEINTALQPLQRLFVQDYLRSARIDTARISGIGAKMAGNLRASGYSTAADINWGVQNVSGIGDSKASALLGWRQTVEAEATRRMPTSLSKAQVDAIVAKYEVQRKVLQQTAATAKAQFEAQDRTLKQQNASAVAVLDRERASAQQQFGQQTQAVTAQFQPQYSLLAQKDAAITTEFSQKVAEVERQTGDIRKSIYDQNWQLAKARQELEIYQAVTFTAYLATLGGVQRIKTAKKP